jgi:hypothetical protein
MSVLIRAIGCFIQAVFYGLLPFALGYALGRIMRNYKFIEYLKALIIRLDEEGKLLEGEKEMLLKAVEELNNEH